MNKQRNAPCGSRIEACRSRSNVPIASMQRVKSLQLLLVFGAGNEARTRDLYLGKIGVVFR